MKNRHLLILIIAVFWSCNYDLQFYKDIQGSWKCIENQGNADFDCDNIVMDFHDERTYLLKESGVESLGAYKIDGNKIHFGPSQGLVASYRIVSIKADTMKWRKLSNNEEIIVFIRN